MEENLGGENGTVCTDTLVAARCCNRTSHARADAARHLLLEGKLGWNIAFARQADQNIEQRRRTTSIEATALGDLTHDHLADQAVMACRAIVGADNQSLNIISSIAQRCQFGLGPNAIVERGRNSTRTENTCQKPNWRDAKSSRDENSRPIVVNLKRMTERTNHIESLARLFGGQ